MESDPNWLNVAWTFFQNLNVQQGLVIANFILVGVTIVLVFITRRYANHTQRMADIMLKDYQLRITPQYEINTQLIIEELKYIVAGIIIRNVGLTPIFIRNFTVKAVPIVRFEVKKEVLYQVKRQIRIDPGDDGDYTELTVGVSEIVVNPPKEGEKFFGKDCNIILTCEISGPTQDFKQERRVII